MNRRPPEIGGRLFPKLGVISLRLRLVQAFQDFQNIIGVGKHAWYVGFTEPNYAPLVYYQHRPVAGPSLIIPKVVGRADFALGVPVGQLGIGQPAHGCGPSPVGVYVIAAYAQNLGIFLFEPAMGLPERHRLRRSTGGEVENVER